MGTPLAHRHRSDIHGVLPHIQDGDGGGARDANQDGSGPEVVDRLEEDERQDRNEARIPAQDFRLRPWPDVSRVAAHATEEALVNTPFSLLQARPRTNLSIMEAKGVHWRNCTWRN